MPRLTTRARRYAYDFDLDVMHGYMVRSFEPFFQAGSLLELGSSFRGDLTKRLLPFFEDVTCVDASDAAIDQARRVLGATVAFVHGTFETASLPGRYRNIILTHVLEHVDDPVRVLKRINDEWLAEGGRLFLVCPNANAPSRQIAVNMGLITHNAAVTKDEAEHGHRRTYSLDTLERERCGSRAARRTPLRDLLQGARELPIRPAAEDRHHLDGVPRRLLCTRSEVPRSLCQHLPAVRARW